LISGHSGPLCDAVKLAVRLRHCNWPSACDADNTFGRDDQNVAGFDGVVTLAGIVGFCGRFETMDRDHDVSFRE